MEKNPGKTGQKQMKLDQYFKPNQDKEKKPYSMEIEPEIEIINPSNDPTLLFEMPLPHQNPKVWTVASQIFSIFASKSVKNLTEFIDFVRDLLKRGYEYPNLENLEAFFSILPEKQRKAFLESILPNIAQIALEIEVLFKKEVPLERLVQGRKRCVELSKKQVACLVVHMFFCTIAYPYGMNVKPGKLNNSWNFEKVFRCSKNPRKNPVKVQKLFCIFHYFERFKDLNFELPITYIRINTRPKSLDDWHFSSKPMSDVCLMDKESIENYIKHTIQLDFANKYLGGGVLDGGMVQEEIRFCISPELLPSMILFDCLLDNEAAILIGSEQFSSYKDYADSFKYSGNFKDPAEYIEKGKSLQRDVVVLAIDARKYFRPWEQYQVSEVLRELNKAFIGFNGDGQYPEKDTKRAVATGKWGCGVFNGDCQLKFVIQWLACAESQRTMLFYRFGEKRLEAAEFVVDMLKGKPVGMVTKWMFMAVKTMSQSKDPRSFFEIIMDFAEK